MRRFIISLVLLASVVTSVWANGEQEGTYGPADAEKKILIAYESTTFKNALVKALVEELNDGTKFIELVNHKKTKLEGIASDNYDVVFITNSGATAKVRPWVSEWIVQNNNAPNIIAHTTQRTEWVPDLAVDSVTSASLWGDDKNINLAKEYAALIENKLK